jgi:germination protein M
MFLVAVMLVGILPGCSLLNKPADPNANTAGNDQTTETVKLYYGDSGNEQIVSEERQISYASGGDQYRVMLEELIKGPQTPGYRANISPEAKVYGTIKQNEDLIVNFNQEFGKFGGSIAEIVGIGSVVNTLTQFGDIKRVKILIEGQEYIGPSGEPRGFIEPFSAEVKLASGLTEQVNKEITLYFSNNNATAVVGEIRNLKLAADISQVEFIKRVVEELIQGPQQKDLYRTIPKEVQVKSVNITNSIAHVDFSEEMHSKHWHGAAGESMTINSMVNTLTEFTYIKKVKMTVEGQPMNIEHAILDEPLGRNAKMIQK